MILGAKAIRRVGYLTQGKMMGTRYSQGVAKILSVMILIFMTFNAASQMVGTGNFFGTYLGLDYELAVLVGTGIVLIYSLFGGFRGVVLRKNRLHEPDIRCVQICHVCDHLRLCLDDTGECLAAHFRRPVG